MKDSSSYQEQRDDRRHIHTHRNLTETKRQRQKMENRKGPVRAFALGDEVTVSMVDRRPREPLIVDTKAALPAVIPVVSFCCRSRLYHICNSPGRFPSCLRDGAGGEKQQRG